MGDARFKYHANVTNVGLTRSLIRAISASSAPYIAIHDAGDISLPDRLYRQVEALDANPAIAAVGCHYIDVIPERNLHVLRRPDAGGASFRSILRKPTFAHGEVTFRRTVYNAAGGYRPEFRYAQDNDLWLRMIKLARFSTVPEVLYHRMICASGISYEPRTFVEQASFYALGRIIAQDPHLEPIALSQLRSGALINDVLPLGDRRVQALILRKILRHLVFGDAALAEATLSAYGRWPPLKALLSAACRLSAHEGGAELLGLIQAALRVRTGPPVAPAGASPDG